MQGTERGPKGDGPPPGPFLSFRGVDGNDVRDAHDGFQKASSVGPHACVEVPKKVAEKWFASELSSKRMFLSARQKQEDLVTLVDPFRLSRGSLKNFAVARRREKNRGRRISAACGCEVAQHGLQHNLIHTDAWEILKAVFARLGRIRRRLALHLRQRRPLKT